MSEHIMENLTIRPLNDVSEKLSKRANEHGIRNGTLSALAERCNRLEAENAKLWELADAVKEFVEDTHCEDCPCRCDCDDNNRIFCVNDFSYHAFAAMRELGLGSADR